MNPALIHLWVVSGLGNVHDLGPLDENLCGMIPNTLVLVRKDMKELVQGMGLFAGKEFNLVSPLPGHVYRFHDKHDRSEIKYPRYYCIGYIPKDFVEYNNHVGLKTENQQWLGNWNERM